jgi:hypothetical protein
MIKLIWPVLIFLGILFVLVIDVGNGLSSPGFWLIPIGVIGGLVSIFRKPQNQLPVQSNSHTALNTSLIIVWLAAFFCIGGSYFSWFTEGLGAFIYLWPAILLTFAGLTLLTIRIVKR